MQSFWDYEERSTIFSSGSTVTLYHLKYMYIHNILKYYIFSSRNELYHSLRRLVYLFEFWMFYFVFLSFLLLPARKTCALLRGRHGTGTGRPATGGLLESEASKQPSQELPSVSTRWPKEAHHPDLLFSILCNISMQAWLT